MKILQATPADIDELYDLQLLAFESEAEMIGSREVPALQETRDDHAKDFPHWVTLKLVNETGHIIGSILQRYPWPYRSGQAHGASYVSPPRMGTAFAFRN